ncbi:MAG: isopentenyl phosphate kinase family protein, partial [Chloroflexota bacterium]|nr:isopentenyl phosphate kinase family protein [Chloroflexota bacterium]
CIFLKLGGSAITDKTREATAREDVIRRVAHEIKQARDASQNPALSILIGHGSGSFGHFAAQKSGFGQRGNWRAYAETGAAAARLTRRVTDIFLAEDVPVVGMQPSASARCRDGELVELATSPIRAALVHNLVPLVYGDVAFDETREMAILSTEMIFAYLAPILKPSRIILAGIVDGVFNGDPLKESSARLIREITPASFLQIESQLRGSHGYDVTGGMIAKVKSMVALVEREPAIRVQIISAMREGLIEQVLTREDSDAGTVIHVSRSARWERSR